MMADTHLTLAVLDRIAVALEAIERHLREIQNAFGPSHWDDGGGDDYVLYVKNMREKQP